MWTRVSGRTLAEKARGKMLFHNVDSQYCRKIKFPFFLSCLVCVISFHAHSWPKMKWKCYFLPGRKSSFAAWNCFSVVLGPNFYHLTNCDPFEPKNAISPSPWEPLFKFSVRSIPNFTFRTYMWLPKTRKLVPETPPRPLPLKAPPRGPGRPKQKWPKYTTISQIMIVNAKKGQLEGGQKKCWPIFHSEYTWW